MNGTLFRVSFYSVSLVVFLHVDLTKACSVTDIHALISGFGESCKYFRWLLGFCWPYVC